MYLAPVEIKKIDGNNSYIHFYAIFQNNQMIISLHYFTK